MKKILFLAPALLLAACAPSQGVKPTVYKARSADILAYIAQVGPTIQPTILNSYFGVTGLTPNAVTLKSSPTTGVQIANALADVNVNEGTIIVTFTALENNGLTSVTHAADYSGKTPEAINKIYALLDARFPRVSSP